MNLTGHITGPGRPIQTPQLNELVHSVSSFQCCTANVAALQHFDSNLDSLVDRVRNHKLANNSHIESVKEALRKACLPESELRFIKQQLHIAETYIASSMTLSTRLFGAAFFHLRRIQSRIKSRLTTNNCCGPCNMDSDST